jgi:hypothetical protein
MDKLPSLEEGVSKLKLSDTKGPKTQADSPKKPSGVVDSWEDDVASSGSSDNDEPDANDGDDRATSTQPNARQELSARQGSREQSSADHCRPQQSYERDSSAITKRPEKSTAAVRRMLAGSLGLKIRPSEETKKFERAQVANERKKREDEKRRVEEEREARRSVWED